MKINGLRWWVVGLIALAAVINYIDRQAMGVLWPEIAKDLYPDKTDFERKDIYAIISVVFMFAYAFGQAIFGKIFDWIGTRLGFALSIGVWSIATALHAFAQGLLSFGIFRGLLGVAEAGNWPGAAKGNAEWFPTNERAFAQGIFNSGAALGGIIAIPLVALLTIYLSWQMIFVTVGLIGLLWLIPWLYLVKGPPKKHPWLSDKEKEYILSGQKNQDADGDGEFDEGYNPTTGKLLSHKQSWGVIIASAAIDPIWWLFVIWIPIYLNEVYGMNVKEIGLYGWVPYVGAMIGAWYGGLLAQKKLKSGWSVDRTRKFVITLGCLIMLPSLLAMSIPGKPSVLAMFGVDQSTSKVMAEPGVKKLLGYDSFKELIKEEDFIKKLAGKDVTEIAADAQVIAALAAAKDKAEANVRDLIEAEKPAEDIAAARFQSPSNESLASLSNLGEITSAKNIAAIISVILMAIILFGFQTAIGNVQTLPSDLYGGKTVGTLSGIAGMAAKFSAAGLVRFVPWLTSDGNYSLAFAIGAGLALLAMASVWLLCPKIEPLKPIS